jgi:hypothetical protein
LKNKKPILIVIIILSSLFFYFYVIKETTVKDENGQIEKIKNVNSKISTNIKKENSLINVPNTIKVDDQKSEPIKIKKIVETKDDNFIAFDKMEKEWLTKVSNLIDKKEYSVYLELRELADKEKNIAYQEYHDYLRQKYGNNFKYNISEDQSIREKKINEKYLQDLLKLIGEEKYKKYLKLKDEYNESLIRNSNGKSVITIEF